MSRLRVYFRTGTWRWGGSTLGMLWLWLFLCRSPLSAADEPRRIYLTGEWRYRSGNLAPANFYLPAVVDTGWGVMVIPTNWYLAGVEHAGVMWFRKRFVADTSLAGKVVRLVMEGVDYTADVWLNGQYLGFHEGYFQPFAFDISDILRPGKENVLVVRVNSPYEAPGEDWSLHKRLIKGIFGHHDTRPGGAWSERGQEKNTGGIWAPVFLRVSRFVALDSVKITPKVHLKDSIAIARIDLAITHTGKPEQRFRLKVRLSPYNFPADASQMAEQEQVVTLIPGHNRVRLEIALKHPRLWWSWDFGKPHLYRCQIQIFRGGQLCDAIEERIGFRTIRFHPVKKVWELNGKRIFLRGTNYIGTQWLAEMNAERYGFDLGLMKQANINGVRVHAHVAAREFYRRCDEMGMLVWQDFPLQWGYVDDPEFYREAERQAKDMIHLLYNHPSVIAWSLHNEPPWDAPWMQYKYRHYNPEQNRALDERLYRALQGMDSTRYLHKYSATGEHPWYGWYSGHWKDYARPTHQPLITEFGAQALPDLPSLQKIFTGEALWPDTEEKWREWEYHNFQRRETFEIAGVPMGNGIEEFIRNTQEYQARLIQYAAESYRRQRYRPVAAIFQFMFVEDWPSVNWGIVDYWRNPKPGYQALRIAYQPVLPGIEWDRQRWEPGETVKLHFWVINDLPKAFPDARLSWTLRQGESIRETQTVTLSIPPDSGRRVVEWKKKGLAPGEYRLQVRLEDARGEVLGTNEFRFTVGQAQ